jgi:hypothetical protein
MPRSLKNRQLLKTLRKPGGHVFASGLLHPPRKWWKNTTVLTRSTETGAQIAGLARALVFITGEEIRVRRNWESQLALIMHSGKGMSGKKDLFLSWLRMIM